MVEARPAANHHSADWKTYLVQFKQKLNFTGYCYAELEALALMFGQVQPMQLYNGESRPDHAS